MIPSFPDSSASITKLVSFLDTQRESILKNWRIACNQDPILENVMDLSQFDFNSGLPVVLNILQQRLLGQPEEGIITQIAITHGLQRQRKTHLVIETVQELNHLTQALYNELPHFQESFPQTNPKLFWSIQQHMSQIMAEVVNGIITTYDQLQRSEAATRAAILQKALDQMNSLSHERSDRLRNSMHDLGGGFGIISGAASLLQLEGISEQDRGHYLDMLNRNLTGVQTMLANLMDLARLEAGQETLQIQPIDAAQLLKEVARSVQPIAQQRDLVIRAEGPESLPVETDGVKLQRIIQNLLLNALKYTPSGFIEISWAEQDSNQWLLRIQDSGPGLPVYLVTQLTGHPRLRATPTDGTEPNEHQPAPSVAGALDKSTLDPNKGEGIGLTIVKEFSQLLSAKLEVEVAQGQGTSFRLFLPIRYPV